MRTNLACCECILRGAAAMARRVTPDESFRLDAMRTTCRMMADADYTLSPPVLAKEVFGKVFSMADGIDPYEEVKHKSTEAALTIRRRLMPRVDSFPDRFEALVRLAIAGNIIDYGVNANLDLDFAVREISGALEQHIEREAVASLKKRMDSAKRIFYILDNCGESVFDRLLLEDYREKVVIGVRGNPVLNDMTRVELEESGFHESDFAGIVDTGDCTPGVDLPNSSPDFIQAFESADLILAKGQGNYETLSEYTDRPLVFLFRAKCPVVIRMLGNVPPMSLQVVPVGKEGGVSC